MTTDLDALRERVLREFERAPMAPYGPTVATRKIMEAIEEHYKPTEQRAPLRRGKMDEVTR